MMRGRGEAHERLCQAFNRPGAKEILVASLGRSEAHQRMIIILEQKSLDLCQAIDLMCTRQELQASSWKG